MTENIHAGTGLFLLKGAAPGMGPLPANLFCIAVPPHDLHAGVLVAELGNDLGECDNLPLPPPVPFSIWAGPNEACAANG